jgi:transcriptional regulator with XRE-family HTH domain
MRVGAILRKWRLAHDFKVREVAAMIGIAPSTLIHIEQGKMPPHSYTLITLIGWLISEGKDAADNNGVAEGSGSREERSDEDIARERAEIAQVERGE